MDEGGKTDTATVSIEVTEVNDRPVAQSFNVTTDEDDAISILLIKTESDIDNNTELNQNPDDILSINILTNPVNGTVEIVNGSVIYTPNLNFNGVDEFEYELIDTDGLTHSAVISINIEAVNDAPVAYNDDYIIDEEEVVILDVLVNDEDIDFDSELNAYIDETLSIKEDGFKSVLHGSVVVINQKVQFTPENNYSGMASFVYTVVDKDGLESEATVSIEILNVNDAPDAIDDLATTFESASVVIDILVNDLDIDLDPTKNQSITDVLSIKSVSSASNGTISIVNNKLVYTPNSKWSGVETFDVVIMDSYMIESSSKLTITVVPVNDLPIAVNDTFVTREDTSILLDVLSNDIDLDLESSNPLASSERLSIVLNQTFRSKLGTVQIVDIQLRYTPNENANGVDVFEYTIVDASGAQSVATVRVTIQPVNDEPNTFIVVNPKSTDKFKDRNKVDVKWTEAIDVDNDKIYYDVYYFDGSNWTLIAVNIEDLFFTYEIDNNGQTNINAQYKVIAKDRQSSIDAFSEKFIVDNESPKNVEFSLSCDGEELINKACSEIVFIPRSSEDLLKYTFYYKLEGDNEWIEVSSLSEIKIDEPGKHILLIRVVDEVGNEIIKEEIIEIRTPITALLSLEDNSWIYLLFGFGLLLILLLFTRPIKLVHIYVNKKTDKTKRITKRYFASMVKKDGKLSIRSNHHYQSQSPDTTYIEIKAWYVKHLRNKHVVYEYSNQIILIEMIDKDYKGKWFKKIR